MYEKLEALEKLPEGPSSYRSQLEMDEQVASTATYEGETRARTMVETEMEK